MTETEPTTETETPCIESADVAPEAYQMGREWMQYPGEFDSLEDVHESLSQGLQQSAQYSNQILPALRELAGFEDAGYGTHQEARTILLDGRETSSRELFSELVDEFYAGIYDKVEEELEE